MLKKGFLMFYQLSLFNSNEYVILLILMVSFVFFEYYFSLKINKLNYQRQEILNQ